MFIVTIDDKSKPDMPPMPLSTEHARVVWQIYWLYRIRTASRQSHVVLTVVDEFGMAMDPRRGALKSLLPFEDKKVTRLHLCAPEAFKAQYGEVEGIAFQDYTDTADLSELMALKKGECTTDRGIAPSPD